MKTILHKSFTFVAIVALISLLIPITSPSYAQAAPACDVEFYSSNDILFYNPCSNTCSTSPVETSSTITELRGTGNGEKIFNFWLDASFTAQQAAGISGSLKEAGGFSPFRQEESKTWEDGGWGIAQFTDIPGERTNAKTFVSGAVGSDLFNKYYKAEYGAITKESNGFVPQGVPIEVNDKFLLAELKYLLQTIKGLEPDSERSALYEKDFGQAVGANVTLYNYLKGIVQSGDVATAWTYLYEWPDNVKEAALVRVNSAATILGMYSKGVSTTCGGNLVEGGMTLEEAIVFMGKYKTGADSISYIGGAGQGCAGGPLSNCVSFSTYFINKYTTISGFTNQAPGNGSTVVANIIARNPSIENGHSPRPYAIFSTASGTQMCAGVKCGHTGVILGVDKERGKVIVGEASCGGESSSPDDSSQDTAYEYELSKFDSDAYLYAYTDGFLKGTVE